jgi:dihydrofolate synthase/folylpolyglutamate synthase
MLALTAPTFDQILDDYYQQIGWLYALVTDPTGDRIFKDKSPAVQKQEQGERLARTADFLDFAGNPQSHYPSIHVAGTSGKGSVVTMMAEMLTAAGYRTGRHISPYLQLCNEKLVVDGRMVSPSGFTRAVRRLARIHTDWVRARRPFNDLRYGEAWVALTYLWFAWQRVDWAVMETGLGGRFDPSNVLPASLAVLTNVNYDHLKSLGPELTRIAWHKAGIIKAGSPAVTAESNPAVLDIFQAEADRRQSPLYRLGRDFDYTVEQRSQQRAVVSVRGPFGYYPHLELAAPGRFQLDNAALAVAGLDVLAAQGKINLTPDVVRETLARYSFSGRVEIVQQQPLVILDGAHNPHKIGALVEGIQAGYPAKKITVLLGMMRVKDAHKMVQALLPLASRFIVSAPRVFGKISFDPTELADIIRHYAPEVEVHVQPTVRQAVEFGLHLLHDDELLLVAGSIYLAGEARDYWFPPAELLKNLEYNQTGVFESEE